MRGSVSCSLASLALLLACAEDPASTPMNVGGAGAGSAGTGGMAGAGGSAAAMGGASAGATALGGGGTGGTGLGGAGLGGGGSSNASGAGGMAGAGAGGQPSLVGLGSISYERWLDVPGEAVTLVPITEPPDVTMPLTAFQMPDDVGQDFGARIRGFLTAPESGSYTFWISCDDNGELNLSADETPAAKQRIAHVTGSPAWTDYVEWTKFPTQKSAPIELVAGKRYYVEALLKEDVAEDHLAVGWSKPSDPQSTSEPAEIIPGQQLSPFTP